MMTTATHKEHYNASAPVLFLAFELSANPWKLGFTIDGTFLFSQD